MTQRILKREWHIKNCSFCGYLGKTGNIVITPKFDEIRDFKEGLAMIKLDRKWGYIDKNGNIAINPQFDYAEDFEEGLAVIGEHDVNYSNDGRNDWSIDCGSIYWGCIDKNGNIVISPQFDYALRFQEGLARIKLGGKWGYIDKNGNIAIKPQLD